MGRVWEWGEKRVPTFYSIRSGAVGSTVCQERRVQKIRRQMRMAAREWSHTITNFILHIVSDARACWAHSERAIHFFRSFLKHLTQCWTKVSKWEITDSVQRRLYLILISFFLIEARRANLDGVGVMLMREEHSNPVLCQVGCCCQYCLPRTKNGKNKEANRIGRARVISHNHKFNSTHCIRRSRLLSKLTERYSCFSFLSLSTSLCVERGWESERYHILCKDDCSSF